MYSLRIYNNRVERNRKPCAKESYIEMLFEEQINLNAHEKKIHSIEEHGSLSLEEVSEREESNIEKHLQEKCEYLEVEIGKERIINTKNKKLIETQLKTIENLKKDVDKANERTKTENSKGTELTNLKCKLNDEVLINEKNGKNIEELQKKVNEYTEKDENPQSGGDCDHADEIKRMKDIVEKTKDTS